MKWIPVDPLLDLPPLERGLTPTLRLRLFQQNTGGKAITALDVANAQAAVARSVTEGIARSRRCLTMLTGDGTVLRVLDTLSSKIARGVELGKEDVQEVIFGGKFTGIGSRQKMSLLRRFFGARSSEILDTLDDYDDGSGKLRTRYSPGYVFRNVLMSTILGLNLRQQGVVLAREPIGSYGASITNWDDWKKPIPEPGAVTFPGLDLLDVFIKGMRTMDDGYLRVNIAYAETPDGRYDQITLPSDTFRNSDMFSLTYIHESCHLFTGASDSYYFNTPFEDGGVKMGEENPNDERDERGGVLTTRCLLNADSYAWLIWLFGDRRFQS